MPEIKRKTLAIIPARGGSKGIPRKNIKHLAGKPLIARTIEPARAAGVFDRVVVSTDDAEIADVARQHHADVPFLRPQALAQDETPTLPVIEHAVQWLKENEGVEYEYVVVLEPTFPLRTPEHIKEALALLYESDADSVVSVVPVPGHFKPHWQFLLNDNQTLSVFTGEAVRDIIPRRQELPVTYTRNGAIYAFKANLLFQENPTMYGEKTVGYLMGEEYSVDIDEPDDWDRAEAKIKTAM